MKSRYLLYLICGVVLLFSCSDSTKPEIVSQTKTTIDLDGDSEVSLAVLQVEGGQVEVRAKNLSWDPEHQLAGFDVYLINQTRPGDIFATSSGHPRAGSRRR